MKCEPDSESKSIKLSNGLISREFSSEEGFRTSLLRFAPDGRNLVDPKHKLGIHGETEGETALCRETMIGIDGIDYNIGLGEGFSYVDHELINEDDGKTLLTARLTNQEGLELKVYLELYDDEPFTVKWIELLNNSDKSVSVTACQPEALTLPAEGSLRWHECTRKVYPTIHPCDSALRPFTYWTYDYSSEKNQPVIWVDHFSSRPEKFGFAMANNYVQSISTSTFAPDKDDSIPILPGMICSCGNRQPGEVFTQFPVGPNLILEPGDSFVSFKTYMTFFEGEYEDGGLALRRMIKKCCPWIDRLRLIFEHTYWTKSVSDKIRETGEFDMTSLKETIDQAAELGFGYYYLPLTLWTQSFGEFKPRPEFPNGVEDIKRISDYVHEKGLKFGLHLPEDYGVDFPDHYLYDENSGEVRSFDIGAPGDFMKRHPEYMLRDKEGNQTRGWMTCGSSGHHEHLLKTKIPFAKAIDCDLLGMDGCYYGNLCYAKDHAHHSPEESQYLNWRLAVERYKAYHEAGFDPKAPDYVQSLFNGNTGAGTYNTETSTHFDIYDFILDMRSNLYDSSYYHPTTAMYYYLLCDPSVMNGADASENPELFDYYFASLASFGVNLSMVDMKVYDKPLQNITKKWLTFINDYHGILRQDLIHLAKPDGNSIDAIMHIAPNDNMRGLVAAFNPTEYKLKRQFVVPSKYLNAQTLFLKDVLTEYPAETSVIKSDGDNFVLDVEVPAKKYSLIGIWEEIV